MIDQALVDKLNAGTKEERLRALTEIAAGYEFPATDPRYINNHIHTIYSFSPYSPTAAVFAARAAGLCTAGIMDHDSMGGAKEFLQAGEILSIPATVGVEFRVKMAGTPMENRRTNNPDQIGVTYMTLHGVPHGKIGDVQARFAPLREARNQRNRAMVENINRLCGSDGIALDFIRDVLPLSQYHDGGGVTERHLLFALAKQALELTGRGAGAIALLGKWGMALSEKQAKLLSDVGSIYYEYDYMGILKSGLVSQIYVPADEECMGLHEAVELGRQTGGILCYPYLGDVEDSVTGDKAAQKFEDGYLDELFQALYENGVRAVTYMPPRNTRKQLLRLRALCEQYGMFEISGEDINSPRQEFVCKAMEDPIFANLIEATWALIRHERGEEKIIL